MEMEENKDEIDTIIKYWRERGAWTCTKRLVTWGGQCDCTKYNVEGDRIACGNAVGICAITWDGNVVSCVMDVDGKHLFGNINDSSIKSIWKMRNETMVKKHLEHKFNELPKLCHDCTDWMIIGEKIYDENGIEVNKNYDENSNML